MRATFGGCLKGFPSDTHWSASGTQQQLTPQLMQSLASSGGGAKLRWVVSAFATGKCNPCQGNTCSKRSCNNIGVVYLQKLPFPFPENDF